jgi:DNA (cytosine-5)-methyltransferase 3A
MKKEWLDVISEHLGVEPIEINSNLLSAQNRKRIYWTNILGVSIPKDKGILLKDIVHENNDEVLNRTVYTKAVLFYRRMNANLLYAE